MDITDVHGNNSRLLGLISWVQQEKINEAERQRKKRMGRERGLRRRKTGRVRVWVRERASPQGGHEGVIRLPLVQVQD